MMRGERLSCCADGFEALLLAPAEARAAYPLVRLGFPAVSLPDWNRFARRANRGARCRRGLVAITVDPKDRRGKRLALTEAGHELLNEALPIWKRKHAEIEAGLPEADLEGLRRGLLALS